MIFVMSFSFKTFHGQVHMQPFNLPDFLITDFPSFIKNKNKQIRNAVSVALYAFVKSAGKIGAFISI